MASLAALKAHLLKEAYEERLLTLSNVDAYVRKCYSSLDTQLEEIATEPGPGPAEGEKKQWVVVCTPKYVETSSGPTHPARMVFFSNGAYEFQVFEKGTDHCGEWKSSEPPHREMSALLDTLLANSGYTICQGIRNYEETFSQHVRFESKNLRVWNYPRQRYDSILCALWHKPTAAIAAQLSPSDPDHGICPACRLLYHDLTVIKQRGIAASPGHKEKWTEPGSNRPYKYLSPHSQATRVQKSSLERKRLRKSLLKYEEQLDMVITGDHDAEVTQLVMAIEERGREELDAIVAEAESTAYLRRAFCAMMPLHQLTARYFEGWRLPSSGWYCGLKPGLVPTSPYQKSFLAWQTWDLMRLCWYGFRDFCNEFLAQHPGYFVMPLRANGSAVETIFSQLKHAGRGTLTAVSYESARGQLLTRRSVHGPHI